MSPAAVTPSLDQLCINVVRGLSIDMVQRANSGHPGLPLGAAPMAHALWSRHLRHAPTSPKWINRDRFVLSAGHGSALLYSLLHVTGYALSLEELKNFRQWGSLTPGHPENHLTPGVEMATGPLGQGFATAVGMAIAERHLAAVFNRSGIELIDHHTYVICSDGDLMEGIVQEAASLAGHLRLHKMIALYDDNQITIDGGTGQTFTEDTSAKFASMGWAILHVDGMDVEAVDQAIQKAKTHDRPTLIVAKTIIGFGSPNRAGTSGVHGSPLGAEEIKLTKANLGLPVDEEFYLPADALAKYREAISNGENLTAEWDALLVRYHSEHPVEAAQFEKLLRGDFTVDPSSIPSSWDKPIATRHSSPQVLNAIAAEVKGLMGGSADLSENVGTPIKGGGQFQYETPEGRNIAFGIREHAMAAAANGITLHGAMRGYTGTFLIFSDYCRPSIRLAALMQIPTIFIFSHDSIGLGEDGPTHQPIEQIMSLRTIPNLNVMRPADAFETAACWQVAMAAEHTPSLLVLTRQNVPILTPADVKDHPAMKGAYILSDDGESPDLILIATGSELQHAVSAAETLRAEGKRIRVVSMPSWFLFEHQSQEYRQSVLPTGVPRLSIEAGVTLGWAKYAESNIGLDRFGASAPGPKLFEEFGFTAENVAKKARELLR